MNTLTPAAWYFLADITRAYDKAEALRLAQFMRDGTIAELDGEPVLCEAPRAVQGRQLRLDTIGGTS